MSLLPVLMTYTLHNALNSASSGTHDSLVVTGASPDGDIYKQSV